MVHKPVDLLVRAERRSFERRRVLTPEVVASLTKYCSSTVPNGFVIHVEDSKQSVFKADEYVSAVRKSGNPDNFTMVPFGSVRNDVYAHSIIAGVKSLPYAPPGTVDFPITNNHAYFLHAFKNQPEASYLLARFCAANDLGGPDKWSGMMLDHEFCVDENNRRYQAYGRSAGLGTAGLGYFDWFHKALGHGELALPQHSYDTMEDYFKYFLERYYEPFLSLDTPVPQAVIFGGKKGRSANGVMDFIAKLNQAVGDDVFGYELRDRKKTKAQQGPNGQAGLGEFGLIFNCTYTDEPCDPFVTDELIKTWGNRNVSLCDVTCDDTWSMNRFRVSGYKTTEFNDPVVMLKGNISLNAVDHSPSFFPREASMDFSDQLMGKGSDYAPLIDLLEHKRRGQRPSVHTPWGRALKSFEDKTEMPINAYFVGKSFVEETSEQGAIDLSLKKFPAIKTFLEENLAEIKKAIQVNLSQISPVNEQEREQYFYHMARGMMGMHYFEGRFDDKYQGPQKLRYINESQTPEALEGCIKHIENTLRENIDIHAIYNDPVLKKQHAIEQLIEKHMECDGFQSELNAIAAPSDLVKLNGEVQHSYGARVFSSFAAAARWHVHAGTEKSMSLLSEALCRVRTAIGVDVSADDGRVASSQIKNAMDSIMDLVCS